MNQRENVDREGVSRIPIILFTNLSINANLHKRPDSMHSTDLYISPSYRLGNSEFIPNSTDNVRFSDPASSAKTQTALQNTLGYFRRRKCAICC